MDYQGNLFENSIIIDDDQLSNNKVEIFDNKMQNDFCTDITSSEIPHSIDEIEFQIDRLKRRWNECTYLIGQRLKYINNHRLFEEKGYTDFSTYVKIALKMSENNAYYYIAIFDYFTEEQTRLAGSKLKLIIPVLNKVKKDTSIPEKIKDERIDQIKNELYTSIRNKTYREAEKLIKDLKTKYFFGIENIEKQSEFKRIEVKSDKIIINESDKETQKQLINIIEDFYNF